MSSHRKGLLSDIPATVDHQTIVDDSDQEEHRQATPSVAIHTIPTEAARTQAHNELLFSTADVGSQSAQARCFDSLNAVEGFYNAGKKQTRSYEGHSCVTLSSDEYFAAIRHNPVIESYRKSWLAEPIWLPRLCGITPSSKFGVHNCADSTSQSSLAHALTEIYSHSSSKSVVISNAHYISQFLVPLGMPYMISMSAVFGVVICTPFYSTFPDAFPDIPDALFSMRNLTIARVIKNPIFRHEFMFNTSLKVEVPSQLISAVNDCRFWQQLEYETEQILGHHIARAPTPMLPIFVNETKKIMLGIMPCSLSPHINFYFDTERLLEGGLSADSQMLDDFLTFIQTMLEVCILPIRKHWIQKMKELFHQANKSAKALVAGFRIAIWLLNQTKIDFINAQIKERAISLIEGITAIESEHYESLLSEQPELQSEASNWLDQQPTILEFCKLCKVSEDSIASIADILNTANLGDDSNMSRIGRLTVGFVWSVLRRSCYQAVTTPRMFSLDEHRIKNLQHQLNSYILERLEGDVSLGCPVKYRKHLPRLMCDKRLEQSPIFLLIEKRVVGDLALRIFRTLVGPYPPIDASQQYTRLQVVSEKKSGQLEALTYEISTLLALHWRGASFLYVNLDVNDTVLSDRAEF